MSFASTLKRWLSKAMSVFPKYRAKVDWKNLGSFLAFFLLAFIFWLMLFFRRDIETTYKIPLKYTHVPHNIVFDQALPEYIEVRLADKGSEIFRYDFILKDSLEIDVEAYKNDNVEMIQGSAFLQLLRKNLTNSTNIKGYNPGAISLKSSKLQQKTLRVVFDGDISTSRNNLVADSISFIPHAVTAYGSKENLSKLDKAVTEYTVFSNLKATSQFKIKIKNEEGVKFVPNEVEVLIPVLEYTEREFEIPITARHLPDNLSVKFFPSQATVAFSVTLEEYKKIVAEDFEISLDYNDFYQNSDGKVALTLTKSPAVIRNARLSPSAAEFLFENR